MTRKIAIVIETSKSAGRYQHNVLEEGVVRKEGKRREISNEVVELLKKVNEKLYEEMPEDSKDLVSRIGYTFPKYNY